MVIGGTTTLALSFERMAAENDPQLKADLEKQAAAYRRLATARAKELGMEPPLGTEGPHN